MRAHTALGTLAGSLMLAVLPATLMAQDASPDVGREVWPEYAAPDEAVAREGRAAMPFTASQIEALGRLLRETQGAIAQGADVPPEGRMRRVRLGSPGDGKIPMIAVRKGYVTAVSFTDATGAPWPIEEVLVDVRFLPEAVLPQAVPHEAAGGDGGGSGRVASHLLYLAPQARSLHGNAVVKLHGLAEPLVASIRGGGAAADFRVEVRLGLPGPQCGARRKCAGRLPCRRSGAAGPAGRHRPAGGRAARGGGRRPRRPGLEAGRRPAAGHPCGAAVAGPLGGGARRRRALGLPAAGHPLCRDDARWTRDAAGLP